MGKRAILQSVLAMILGLNVAAPMVLDVQGIAPQWPWQYHALVGFVVFVVMMIWVIFEKQGRINKLEAVRPQMTLGDKTGVRSIQFDEKESKVNVELYISYRNIGMKPAYNPRLRVGFAPHGIPKAFGLIPDRTNANRIDTSSVLEHGEMYDITQPYQEKDGKREIQHEGMYIYCQLRYSDAADKGKVYCDEWWLSYRFAETMVGSMVDTEKHALEPYVKLACQQMEAN